MNCEWIEEELAKGTSQVKIVEKFRYCLYRRVLADCDNNKSETTRRLKMSRNSLDYWLKDGVREYESSRKNGKQQHLPARPRKDDMAADGQPGSRKCLSAADAGRLIKRVAGNKNRPRNTNPWPTNKPVGNLSLSIHG